MTDAIDHGRTVLGAIFADRDGALAAALAGLTPGHFTDKVQGNLFVFAQRYHEQTGKPLPRDALTDILRDKAPGTVLKYEEVYDLCLEAADGEFRWSVQQLRELHAERVTGEAITAGFEILRTGKRVGDRELRGWADARAYLSTALEDAGGQDGEPSSWKAVDISAILAGTYQPLQPSVAARADGLGLFYPGKIHALGAEPEAAKTWLVLLGMAQEMAKGNHAEFVDFEDDELGVTGRMLAIAALFGLTAADIRERFHYIRPDEPLFSARDGVLTARSPALAGFLRDTGGWAPTIAAFDGMTEALAMHGLSARNEMDVALWQNEVLKRVARLGAAVIQNDHVGRDREARGRFDLGSQHKLAGIDGASYALVNVKPFGIGMEGASDLYIRKDRHGQLRRHGRPAKDGMSLLGRFTLASGEDGIACQASVGLPPEAQNRDRPTFMMDRVSGTLAELQESGQGPFSKNSIELAVKGDNRIIRTALEALVLDGYVLRTDGPRNSKLHRLTRRFPDGSPP